MRLNYFEDFNFAASNAPAFCWQLPQPSRYNKLPPARVSRQKKSGKEFDSECLVPWNRHQPGGPGMSARAGTLSNRQRASKRLAPLRL